MKIPRTLRRSLITVLAAGYYIGVGNLTGLDMRFTSMAQFFGHALIYTASVGLVSAMLFVVERSSSN